MSAMVGKKKGSLGTESGIALLLVLWVIVFLAFVCAEFSWTMRTETATATNFKEGTQAYYAAEAGVNRAIVELLRVSGEARRAGRAEAGGDAAGGMVFGDDGAREDELRLWRAGGGPYRFELGDFYCEVDIVDESNKININEFLSKAQKDPTMLKMFLEKNVGLEGEERDIVADSLIDWWDKDSSVSGLLGAEDGYYESLDPPYRCRNGELPVLEECLLVRGVTERIFYGRSRPVEQAVQLTSDELAQLMGGGELQGPADDGDRDFSEIGIGRSRLGLADLFSVNSSATSLKININSASFEQLMLLDGMQAGAAREIMAERSQRPFESPTDRLPQYANYEAWKGMIRVQQPFAQNNYTVRSRGFSRDGRVSRSVTCSLLVSTGQCIISDWRIDA